MEDVLQSGRLCNEASQAPVWTSTGGHRYGVDSFSYLRSRLQPKRLRECIIWQLPRLHHHLEPCMLLCGVEPFAAVSRDTRFSVCVLLAAIGRHRTSVGRSLVWFEHPCPVARRARPVSIGIALILILPCFANPQATSPEWSFVMVG